MTRLPDAPPGTRLLPDARLYQVRRGDAVAASFSALESAVEHIQWMLRQEPAQRLTLDILPPVEVKAPCQVCGADVMVTLETARRILSGDAWVEHSMADRSHLVLARPKP